MTILLNLFTPVRCIEVCPGGTILFTEKGRPSGLGTYHNHCLFLLNNVLEIC